MEMLISIAVYHPMVILICDVMMQTFNTNNESIVTQQNVMSFYPMLCADSRFWLAKTCEEYTHISHLTSSSWDIKRKERHWWRHNDDHGGRPLFLPLRWDRGDTVFIQWFRLDKMDRWDFKDAETL